MNEDKYFYLACVGWYEGYSNNTKKDIYHYKYNNNNKYLQCVNIREE